MTRRGEFCKRLLCNKQGGGILPRRWERYEKTISKIHRLLERWEYRAVGVRWDNSRSRDLSLTAGYKNLEKLVITHILHSLRNSKLISRLLERFVLFLWVILLSEFWISTLNRCYKIFARAKDDSHIFVGWAVCLL